MTLKQWFDNKWLVEHRTSPQEIKALISIVDRDLRDSAVAGLSPDWKLAIAYNAALQCSTAALAAAGYRPAKGGSHHYYSIESLRFTLKSDEALILTLDAFRKKRNISDYEHAGTVSETEVSELRDLAKSLREQLEVWLKREHPELLPGEDCTTAT